MKNKLLITLVFLLLPFLQILAQNQPIEQRKSGFFLEDRPLKPKNMLELMKDNPAAFEEMKQAKSNSDAASVFAFLGGGLIGWTIGGLIGPSEPTWGLGAAGVGLVLVAIPFSSTYIKRASKATEIYNSEIKQTGLYPIKVNFGFSDHGVGLSMKF
ncbi:hypothetical protein [Aquiflexum sp.]|uniref:hypothetical protein n=1 Tax=Aquiflexum sp. TaxID=1872584 RepID=UPI0035930D0D